MRGTFAGPEKLLSSISFTGTILGIVFVFKFLDQRPWDCGLTEWHILGLNCNLKSRVLGSTQISRVLSLGSHRDLGLGFS